MSLVGWWSGRLVDWLVVHMLYCITYFMMLDAVHLSWFVTLTLWYFVAPQQRLQVCWQATTWLITKNKCCVFELDSHHPCRLTTHIVWHSSTLLSTLHWSWLLIVASEASRYTYLFVFCRQMFLLSLLRLILNKAKQDRYTITFHINAQYRYEFVSKQDR